MPAVVSEPVDTGPVRLQPPGKHEDRQREAVHLSEERDNERTECTEASPVPRSLRFEEAKGEDDKHRRVDEDEEPEEENEKHEKYDEED